MPKPFAPLPTQTRSRLILLLCFACCASGLLVACTKTPEVVHPTQINQATPGAMFAYQEAVLPNGLRVVTLEDHSTPVVSVQLWYHVGSKDEQPNRRGFAHMFEHMMFRGTPRLGAAEHQTLIQSTGGNANAYTSFDQTVYTQRVPSNQLELVMWLESERMAFLRIDDEGFFTERKVVAEEYHRTAEQPYGTVLDYILPKVFGGGMYSWSPIGDMAELKQAGVGELQTFWEQFYVPNNATLVVVGDIKHADVQAMASHYFGWIPKYGEKPAPAVPPTGIEKMPKLIEFQDPKGPVPIVGVLYRTVPSGHPDETPLQMLGEILGGGEASRLYQKMVVQDQLASVALAGAFSLQGDGVFGAGAVLAPLGGDREAALKALRDEITRIQAEGPTEREVQRVKNGALRSMVASQLEVDSKASILGTAAVLYNDLPLANTQLEELRAITAADIRRVAQQYLTAERASEIRIEPSLLGFLKPNAETQPEDAPPVAQNTSPQTWGKPGLERPDNISEKPPIQKPLDADITPQFFTHTLPNGLKVVVLSNHEVPFVTFSLGINRGAIHDPKEAPGTAFFAAQMLTRGTKRRGYSELSEALAFDAVSLGGAIDLEDGGVNASAVTDQAGLAMAYLAEVVQTPTFPEDQLALVKDQYKTGRQIQETSPDYIAEREVGKRLCGDHPYGREAAPELAQLDAITVDGLKAWWTANVLPKTTTFYIAGDITKEAAIKLAEEHFGAWRVGDNTAVLESGVPALPEPKETHIYLVDQAAEQAQIRVVYPGISRGNPDYIKTRVLNQVFGGGSLNSWLNKAIRGDKGLTYGAYGGFRPRKFSGVFAVSTFSKNESVVEVLETILGQIDRLRTTPPTPEEVEQAQRFITGDFVLSRETPQAAIEDLWLIESLGLPSDYLGQLMRGVAATTPEDVQKTAAKLIDPKRLIIVVVGPASELEKALSKIAPVTVVK